MGNIDRMDRINSEIQKEIYDVIKRKIKNPLVTEMFSVTAVDTSKDLKHAKVFISVYSTNEERKRATYTAIVNDAKKVRYELSKVMRMRTVPEIQFITDNSLDYGDKMDKLFLRIEKELKGDKGGNN